MPNLSIVAYPTVSGMQRALNLNAGMALQVKYIAVGSGLQALQFDDGGRVMTDTLANLVGYVEVATAEKVSPYQWQMTVNLAGLNANEWRLSEFALCDADHNVIAIYGSATQAIYPVTPYVTDALLSVNLLLAAFPANSVVIEHHNQPLELFWKNDLQAIQADINGKFLRLENFNSTVKRQYKKIIKINGSESWLYPLIWTFPGSENGLSHLTIRRGYTLDAGTADPSVYGASHIAGLLINIEACDCSWGGSPKIFRITEFGETYANTTSHARYNAHSFFRAINPNSQPDISGNGLHAGIYLRGGG